MEEDTQKVVVLPGFEVSQARQKPISDILVWVQCFARYAAVMAQKYPASAPGFMSHMLVVLKAVVEVEGVAWRHYDECYREKMAATGVREWEGIDVQLFQEICGSHPRKVLQEEKGLRKVSRERKSAVCWQFNEGKCSYGGKCRFPHVCEVCGAGHPKLRCTVNIKKPRMG
jgi:hypothetical protein